MDIIETKPHDYFMGTATKVKEAGYSMRVVARLTGLSPDTVRAWERRYEAVVPERSDGNTRKFSAADVRKLTFLKGATEKGYRIGDIARLPEEELRGLIESEGAVAAALSPPAGEVPGQVAFERLRGEYLEDVGRYRAREARGILARAAAVLDPQEFVLEVVLPIMRETGDLWEAGELTVAQEHLVSMQMRGLLDSILRVSAPHPGAPKIICATPPGQHHEFGALAGALWAAMRGFDVLYFGADVPADDIVEAAEATGAEVILLSVILVSSKRDIIRLAKTISRIADAFRTWVGLAEDHPLVSKISAATCLHRFDDFDTALTSLLR